MAQDFQWRKYWWKHLIAGWFYSLFFLIAIPLLLLILLGDPIGEGAPVWEDFMGSRGFRLLKYFVSAIIAPGLLAIVFKIKLFPKKIDFVYLYLWLGSIIWFISTIIAFTFVRKLLY